MEDIEVKIPFYKQLGEIVKPEGILASNTSSLPIHSMADPSGRPDRVVSGFRLNEDRKYSYVELGRFAFFQSCANYETGRSHSYGSN